VGEKNRSSTELELARRRRSQEMAAEQGVIKVRTRPPFLRRRQRGHVMAHEVALQFLAQRISLPPTVKMSRLGFWISEPFHFNSKKDLFPFIQNRGYNDDRINDHRSWIKR
jgi:hypothetical protein